MKKAVSFVLSFLLVASLFSIQAFAAQPAQNYANPAVGVEYVDDIQPEVTSGVVDYGLGGMLRAYSVQDLGSASVNWSIQNNETIRSSYNYKTSSGKIKLSLQSTKAVTVNYYLYDTSDTLIASYSVPMSDTKTTVITFSNLFTNREYYIKAENVGNIPTAMTGVNQRVINGDTTDETRRLFPPSTETAFIL